jgi:parallel beta-helix repeat protein
VHIEITNNLIAYNHKESWGYGIYLMNIYSSPVISDNTITENGYGIYLDNSYVSQPPSGSYAWHTETMTYHTPQVLERSFDLGTLAPGDTATLTFWQYYDFLGVGGGCVQVFDAPSGSWMTLMPIDSHGYENPNVQRLFNSPGYTTNSRAFEGSVFFETFTGSSPNDGCDDGWIMAEFDLSAYAGSQNVQVRWFANDWVVPSTGWYIDDVTLYGNGAMIWEDNMEGGVGTWTAEGWNIERAGGVISGNEISNHLGYGIESYNYVYLDIEMNQITGNGYNGIFMQSAYSNLYDAVRPAAPSGTHMWYSGYSNYADFTMEQTFDLRNTNEVTLGYIPR